MTKLLSKIKLMPQRELQQFVDDKEKAKIDEESKYLYKSAMESIHRTIERTKANYESGTGLVTKELYLGLRKKPSPEGQSCSAESRLTKSDLKYLQPTLDKIKKELKEAGYKHAIQFDEGTERWRAHDPSITLVVTILEK